MAITFITTMILRTETSNSYIFASDQRYHPHRYHTHQKFLSKYRAFGPYNLDIPCYTPQTSTYTPYTLILPSNPFHRNHSHLNRQMESGALKNFRQELWNTKMNYFVLLLFCLCFFSYFIPVLNCSRLLHKTCIYSGIYFCI